VFQQPAANRPLVGIGWVPGQGIQHDCQNFAALLIESGVLWHLTWLIDRGLPPVNSNVIRQLRRYVYESPMIRLTRLNRAPMVLNSDLIEHIDVTPDTVITLTTGQILRVRESADEVVERIVDFRRRVFRSDAPPVGDDEPAPD
jgi:flagellar protein FlbD